MPFSFPYLAPVKTQPVSYSERDHRAGGETSSKRTPQTENVRAQELTPREPENSVASRPEQEPYFE